MDGDVPKRMASVFPMFATVRSEPVRTAGAEVLPVGKSECHDSENFAGRRAGGRQQTGSESAGPAETVAAGDWHCRSAALALW